MKKVIWKYQLSFNSETYLSIPKDSKILTVQVDKKNNAPHLWILVNPENEKEERLFELYGTGINIHYNMGVNRKYIGTYQYQNGEFIGHVFERNIL